MGTPSKKRPKASATASTAATPTPPPPKKGSAKPKASPGSALCALQGKDVKGTRTKG